MGSLLGHLVSSAFLLLYGLLWMLQTFWLRLGYVRRRKSNKPLEDFDPRPVDTRLEPLLDKIVPSILGGVYLILYCDVLDRYFQEATQVFSLLSLSLYSSLVVSAVVDTFGLDFHLPFSKTSQIFTTLSLLVSTLVMLCLTNGRTQPLQFTLYLLFTLIVMATTFLSGMRLFDDSLLSDIGFSLALILQGTWLAQIGYLLNSDYQCTSISTADLSAMFLWHIATVSVVAAIAYAIMGFDTTRSRANKKESTRKQSETLL